MIAFSLVFNNSIYVQGYIKTVLRHYQYRWCSLLLDDTSNARTVTRKS